MHDAQRISQRLVEACITEMDLPADVARDVAFHMTDWLEDLRRYSEFCEAPETATAVELNALLMAFLVHVPNHLAAAAKLYADMPVSDVFSVGAVRGEGGDVA